MMDTSLSVQSANSPITPTPSTYGEMVANYQSALSAIDDVVLKNYLTKIEAMDVVELDKATFLDDNLGNISLFKINQMVYEKDEYATNKFATVFNALSGLNCGLFIIMKSDGRKTDFYMGTNAAESSKGRDILETTLKNALQGQFPGVNLKSFPLESDIKPILADIPAGCISSVSCVANIKNDSNHENRFFIQGLEKLAIAMQGQKYTGIILANSVSAQDIDAIRSSYETIYSQLIPYAKTQISYQTNNTETTSDAHSEGTNWSHSHAETRSSTVTEGSTDSSSETKKSTASKVVAGIGVVAGIVGLALAPVTFGASAAAGAAAMAATATATASAMTASSVAMSGMSIANAASNIFGDTKTKGTSTQHSVAEQTGSSSTDQEGGNQSDTHTQGYSYGTSQSLTLNNEAKRISNILERLNVQMKRLDEFESLGLWECSAYFLTDSNDKTSAEVAAATYRALMSGEHTGVESSAVNSWHDYDGEIAALREAEGDDWEKYMSLSPSAKKVQMIQAYLRRMTHPSFSCMTAGESIEVSPCSMVSGNELALHMGLPRHSVCGLPVVEHASFGREVNFADVSSSPQGFILGDVYNMGRSLPMNVQLDKERFSMHTFVTGSTGSGKSNAVYNILQRLGNLGVKYLVIEPAKGEYKDVFGKEARVFGTNPQYAEMLHINPFRFPEGIHVLEHVDRLIEIFNVCWPMYAAMPAVLKDAVLQAYESCGWDLENSINRISPNIFPGFSDLQEEIVRVVRTSEYSADTKGDYIGSLATRVKSLCNGINGQIFSGNEVRNDELFDANVIVDLSRVGSQETKSLIMGILIMRLNEYRMTSSCGRNLPLKHITVLEEAHNILKRTSTEQNPESSNMAGKSVELLSNAIAEMRTYGEGFIIADQSPSAVDISAIRNTNTKIIMRLPDEADRKLAGRAAALKDEQLDEIAKLPRGVAVVYQNDWIEPVLCKIRKFEGVETDYRYSPAPRLDAHGETWMRTELLNLLLRPRIMSNSDASELDMPELRNALISSSLSGKQKVHFLSIINEFERDRKLLFWENEHFEQLSKDVVDVLGCRSKAENAILTIPDVQELNQELSRIIDAKTTYLRPTVHDNISQCIIKDYCRLNPSRNRYYETWCRQTTELNQQRRGKHQ